MAKKGGNGEPFSPLFGLMKEGYNRQLEELEKQRKELAENKSSATLPTKSYLQIPSVVNPSQYSWYTSTKPPANKVTPTSNSKEIKKLKDTILALTEKNTKLEEELDEAKKLIESMVTPAETLVNEEAIPSLGEQLQDSPD